MVWSIVIGGYGLGMVREAGLVRLLEVKTCCGGIRNWDGVMRDSLVRWFEGQQTGIYLPRDCDRVVCQMEVVS